MFGPNNQKDPVYYAALIVGLLMIFYMTGFILWSKHVFFLM